LTVTVYVNGEVAAHEPVVDVGVIRYTTSIAAVDVFVNTSVIVFVDPEPVFGVIPVTAALVQVKLEGMLLVIV
jgi:hypothetical protein